MSICRSKKVNLIHLDWRVGVRCSSCDAQGPKINTCQNSTSWSEPALRWNEYAINLVEIKKSINKKQIA